MNHLLIVEDNKVLRTKLSQIFASSIHNCRVLEAANGNECNEAMKQQPVDMIIMDIRLAESNGLKLTKKIKSQFPDIYIAILTMYDSEEYRSMAKDAGADIFFSKKSNSIQELISVTRLFLGDQIHKPAQTNTQNPPF
jgi:DNA-binding NarL/FixJ family response regulator